MKGITYPIRERIRITRVNSFFTLPCSNTYEFSGESHTFWELMYVIRGKLCVSADERVYHISEGQIVFHQPLELHKFHVTAPEGAEILVLSYDMEGKLQDFFREKVFLLDQHQKRILSELISYAQAHAEPNSNCYDRFLSAFQTVSTYSQKVSLYVTQLLLSLAEGNSITPSPETEDSILFTKTVQYMNERISQNLSVTDIASALHVSVSTLKKMFKKYAGLGVHKYFLKLKLKAAVELLGNGSSVTSVAEKLGFSSQGYFTNVFKREFGELPSDYLHC